jgi:TolA-binding protein
MNIMTVVVCSLFSVIFAQGCSSWFGETSKLDETVPQTIDRKLEDVKVDPKGSGQFKPPVGKDDEVYLQQARIMNRMSEIENELKYQRERIRLLEHGLLTGIPPEELKQNRRAKSSEDAIGHNHHSIVKTSEPLRDPHLDHQSIEELSVAAQKSHVQEPARRVDSNILAEKFKIVRDHFQASRFSKVISELGSISRDHGETAGDGQIKFWLGKAYSRLKEFSTARVELEAYISQWPKSEEIPEARIELSRVYTNLGLKERARGELRRVMKDFEGQEFGNIAAAEFNKLQGTL